MGWMSWMREANSGRMFSTQFSEVNTHATHNTPAAQEKDRDLDGQYTGSMINRLQFGVNNFKCDLFLFDYREIEQKWTQNWFVKLMFFLHMVDAESQPELISIPFAELLLVR